MKTLQVFYEQKLNITRIESKPSKLSPHQTDMIVDVEGICHSGSLTQQEKERINFVWHFCEM